MLVEASLILVFAFVLTYLFKYNFDNDYWKKKNIAFEPRRNVFGIIWDFITNNKSLFEIIDDIYHKYPDAPVIGSYMGPRVMVIPKDLINIQHIMSTNFQDYHSRGSAFNFDKDVLADSIIFNDGNKWRIYRQKLTPVFTGAKLKNMFSIMTKNSENFVKYLDQECNDKTQAFSILTNFAASSLLATIFGTDIDNHHLQESKLKEIATKSSGISESFNWKVSIALMSPRLFKLLGLTIFADSEKEFVGFVKKVLRARERENVQRKDFINTCVQLQKEKILKDPTTGFEVEATDEQMAAQAFFFFIAGIEPSATVMFFTLLELARHPDIQLKVQDSIDKLFEDSSDNITFEDIEKLTYLDMVIDEATRLYPPISVITRQCTADTVLPVGGLKISKGTFIFIPIYSIHHDERYFDNPEKFDPERFQPELKQSRPRYSFIPFGEGNRQCIGNRFAKIQIKAGIVHVLRDFNVKTSKENAMKSKINFSKSIFALRAADANFQFEKRQK